MTRINSVLLDFAESLCVNLASICGLNSFECPIILSMAGLTNSSNVTITDTGLPGRQKTGF